MFIDEKLAPVWTKLPSDGERKQDLIGTMLGKAEGVFLWVRLVIANVFNGLIESDEWVMLQERISALPDELYLLYSEMWKRRNQDTPTHRARAAMYLKLLLVNWNFSTASIMFLASDIDLQRRVLAGGVRVSEEEILSRFHAFYNQLLAKCAGFVELSGVGYPLSINIAPGRVKPSTQTYVSSTKVPLISF